MEKIVLTGGPCSGKSTSLAYLTEKLSDYGFAVFTVPETASLLINSGIDPRKMQNPEQHLAFEESILDLQLGVERDIEQAAKRTFPDKRSVILLDRGIMDIKAYIPHEYQDFFHEILRSRGLNEVAARDNYTGVVHLVTAADGAAQFYSIENNPARLEKTVKEAIVSDQAVQKAWLGHPHLKVIDNRTDFEGKIKRTLSVITRFLGVPVPLEIEKRFLVRAVDYTALPSHQVVEIEQMYLMPERPGEQLRIRKRGQNGSYLYFLTRKQRTSDPSVRIENEQIISAKEYVLMQKLIEPGTRVVRKRRICFLWRGQYFELDTYEGLNRIILEIELTETYQEVVLPDFLTIDADVTGDLLYETRSFAEAA